MTDKWEYRTVQMARSDVPQITERLDRLGADGYELVTVVLQSYDNEALWIFKRSTQLAENENSFAEPRFLAETNR